MPQSLRVGLGVVVVVALIAGPAGLAVHDQYRMRNFRVVQEGVLYRSGQMTRAGLQRAVHDYGIRTVICLRDGLSAADQAEEKYCAAEGVRFVRIPPSSWSEVGGVVPAEEGLRKFRALLADPKNHPVLVHCFAGVHRTGAYSAIYRMEFQRWSNARAIAELKACGYSNLDDEWDVLGYLEQYRPSWAPAPESAAHSE